MPVFNGGEYLRQAIRSVLDQDYPSWELVIVDDGSTDATAQIVAETSDPRIRYTYQDNRGQTVSLNRGLGLAQGEYITTLDADDWLPANSLSARCQVLEESPELGVVYGDGMYRDGEGNEMLRFSEQMPAGISGDVYDTLIVSPFYGTGAAVMLRRSLLDHYAIRYDEQIAWCQDWDIYIRLAAITGFGFTPQNTINYRIHSGGMTVTMPGGRRLESLIRLRKKVLASSRFEQVAIEQKAAFYYDYLLHDLHDRTDDQALVFESSQFTALPASQQSRLLRLTAIDYLLKNEHIPAAKKWLWAAWMRSPADPKSLVAYLIAAIHPVLTQKVLGRWHAAHNQANLKSPFEVAVK
jgi:glycosyltransferase involved in cell wall biosynthesis